VGRGKKSISTAKPPKKGLFGFLSAKSDALETLARIEGFLEVMELSTADFSTPQKLLEEARTSLASKDYRRSLKLAEQAERLAQIIEERFRAARKAMNILSSEIKELEELGLDTTAAVTAYESAKQRIKQGTMEDGVQIPNYLEARLTAEEASKQARGQIIKAREASDLIFTAQLAIEALKEMEGPVDAAIMENTVVAPLDATLQKSTESLALGNLEEASALAKEAEDRANQTRADYSECITSIESCENVIKALSMEGVPFERASQMLGGGRNLLLLGKVTEAREAIVKAEKEALMVSNQFRKAVAAIDAADVAVKELSKTGMKDLEAERRLGDAKKALSNWKYLRALDLAEDCRRSIAKRIELHDDLARSLRELRETADNMRTSGVTFAGDIDEILGRAEREFEEGDYSSCAKDMKIASLLVGTSGSGGKNPLYLLKEYGP